MLLFLVLKKQQKNPLIFQFDKIRNWSRVIYHPQIVFTTKLQGKTFFPQNAPYQLHLSRTVCSKVSHAHGAIFSHHIKPAEWTL